MGRKKSYTSKSRAPITVALQAMELKHVFPQSEVTLNKNAALSWIGQIQPSPLSQNYTVNIKYKLRKRPRVTIVTPKLVSRNGEKIPHLFRGEELCLFRYTYFEWNSSMSLAETIVPWTALWLLHYEVWLAVGKWCGSNEEHPEDNRQKEPDQATGEN